MSSLLVKANASGRTIVSAPPREDVLRYVGFEAWRLLAGDSVEWEDAARECCVVVLCGRIRVKAGDFDSGVIGRRTSVFEDVPPYAVYLPAGRRMTLYADTDAEVALCLAPGSATHAPRVIAPEAMRRTARGEGTNRRFVVDILAADDPLADSLLVTEVRTPTSHSSSYPPHKHDTDALPAESALEETYYHRIDPPQGFVFQRVYTDDRSLDESNAAEDHDVVMVPRGYHPVVVPHGYESYYLNVMAGPHRQWVFRNDPAHEWMLKQS